MHELCAKAVLTSGKVEVAIFVTVLQTTPQQCPVLWVVAVYSRGCVDTGGDHQEVGLVGLSLTSSDLQPCHVYISS